MSKSKEPEATYGPYVLRPQHRHLAKIAAKEASRYALHHVALYSEVPMLVATDGRKIVYWPIERAKDTESEEVIPPDRLDPKEFGEPVCLVPSELFSRLPGGSAREGWRRDKATRTAPRLLLRFERNGTKDAKESLTYTATVETWVYGKSVASAAYECPTEGRYPEVGAVFVKPKRKHVRFAFDISYLSDLAQVLGPPDNAVRFYFEDEKSGIRIDVPAKGETPQPVAVLMPVTLQEG
ncbi:MAG: hypothetical protein L0216_09170 [Planctomycetales bacterium]|nr:hypothetical protein [Planctomycetales bacterium]